MNWFIILLLIKVSWALDNGLALTPPMGWVWDSFLCKKSCSADVDAEDCISDLLIRRKADRLKAEGFVEAGYKYILIASCWQAETRDPEGNLRPDPRRFPNGIKPLAKYLRRLGMKLGLSLSLGDSTCAGRFEGSRGHYDQDAKAMADWGVDMVKAQGCFLHYEEFDEAYVMMGFALNSTGRRINYACDWPAILLRNAKPVSWNLVRSSCNMWDLKESNIDSWQELISQLHYFYHYNGTFVGLPGKGGWNYPGSLKIDGHLIDGNMSLAHIAVYSFLGFPLFLKGPLKRITAAKARILKDPVLLSILNDPLGEVGFRIKGHFYNGIHIYVRRLVDQKIAVLFFNIQIAEAIYSSYPLNTFLPFFPGADEDTRLIIKDVYNKSEQALPFKAIFEVRRFHPASCLLLTMEIDEHQYLRNLKEKLDTMMANTFLSNISLQLVLIFVLVTYLIHAILYKLCYDLFVKRKERLNKLF